MNVLNDFYCDHCGSQFYDQFLDNEITTIDCLTCGNIAKKVQHIPTFMLPGNDAAGFPTAHDKWVKKREQKLAQEQKTDNS